MSLATVVVLGSNCFSGSHMVDLLLEHGAQQVLGISRSPEKSALYLPYLGKAPGRYQFHQINMTQAIPDLLALLDRVKPAVIINFAALSEVFQSNETPSEYFRINTQAVVDLCSALRQRAYLKQYIHVSSAEVYGHAKGHVREDAPVDPTSAYAASKAAADLYLLTLFRRFNFPVRIIRSTNVYGRHQQLFKIIPRTIIYLKQGKKIPLHGGGSAVRVFIHIRDVCAGILACMQKGRSGGIYHFATDFSHDIAWVVRFIAQQMGQNFQQVTEISGERAGQDDAYWLDCRLSAEELGWQPQISFTQGVTETIDWIEANWQAIRDEPHVYRHVV